MTIDTDPNCPCGATAFEIEYSATGYAGNGAGWYVREPGATKYAPGPGTPWVRNGTCVSTGNQCVFGVDTTNPNPENTYIAAYMLCKNHGSNNYEFEFTFSYVRLRNTGFMSCLLNSVNTFVFNLNPQCSPFYATIPEVGTNFVYNESGCNGPGYTVAVTITE